MICWIHNDNLETYEYLCHDEGSEPMILEQAEGKVCVVMSPHIASVWNMMGYWYEMD